MSKKPLKKSDLGKSWLKSRSDNKKKICCKITISMLEIV